jgi:hypothetical protein
MATHRRLLSELVLQIRSNLDEPTAAFWADAPGGLKPDLYGVTTRAAHAVATEIRKLKKGSDYFLINRASTDGTVTIYGVSYLCSSFQIVPGTREYTLPPDCLEVKLIEVITPSYESIEFFLGKDMTDPGFRSARNMTQRQTPTFFYADVVGERTLTIAPHTDSTLDLRLWYVSSACIVSTAGASLKDFATATDELIMPHPAYMAVEEVATARAMILDRNNTAAVYAQLADASVARFFGAEARQSQDPSFVQGLWQ